MNLQGTDGYHHKVYHQFLLSSTSLQTIKENNSNKNRFCYKRVKSVVALGLELGNNYVDSHTLPIATTVML